MTSFVSLHTKVESLRETLSTLQSVKVARREHEKNKLPSRPDVASVGIISESEDEFECPDSRGELECGCLEIFYTVETFIKVSCLIKRVLNHLVPVLQLFI